MKKALVLGVLAIFAISIANVNAQDRTNVQEKPKKTYTQEPASKNVDTKAINQTKQQDPASKNVTPKNNGSKVLGTKGGNKVQKNKNLNDAAKKQTDPKATTVTDVKPINEKQAVESETAPKGAKASSGKNVTGKANSVPPTPKEKKAEKKTVEVKK